MTGSITGAGEQALPESRFDKGALADLAVILLVLVGVKQSLLPFTMLFAGPASTFSAMIVGTYLLRRRGMDWRDLGLRWPDSWMKTGLLTVFTFGCFALMMGTVGEYIDTIVPETGTSGRFDHVEGNLLAYIGMMVLVWTHASFFEELLFRAFIMNRTSAWLGGGLKGDIVALVFSTVFFGYRHYYYKGLNGALTTGLAGLTFGILYLWFGRKNILPLVFTHGFVNSMGQTLRYLGLKDD